jgi:RNA-directed DNA polymerase
VVSSFDNIGHDWLIANVPMDKVVLRKWLESGFVHNGELFATEAGTPQGGIISPMLANMTLDGMERVLRQRFAPSHPQCRKNKVNLIRYADDFVVTGASKELLEEARSLIVDFLRQRGLTLSEEKTKIVHIEEGFDFLGWNVRKYNGKLLIKPAKKNVQTFLRKVRAIIRDARTAKQEYVIRRLNPVIRRWANYHRNQVAKETFQKVDHLIWKQLWQWACRRHPHKPLTWVKDRYFAREGMRNWVFRAEVLGDDGTGSFVRLVKAGDVPIRRHRKIKAEANPFDPKWDSYFVDRQGLLMDRQGRKLPPKLWKAQGGVCPVCRELITVHSGWEIHHVVPRAHDGSEARSNLVLLHTNCHWQAHSYTWNGELAAPVKRGFVEA